ncbi:MAG: DUF3089 domain-containing protein [Deltaproteobacteria bacterium]|nr:DUF3089 domain-containing protein [Deltaproteobacteria bacterium]
MRALLLLILVATSSCSCDPCDPNSSTPLDYDDDESWLCRGGDCDDNLAATEVLADDSLAPSEHTAAVDPAFACFYVYPTVDLALRPGVHKDFEDSAQQRQTFDVQAARFSEVCTVHAPLYRQVTIGSYFQGPGGNQACFETAFGDVARAFETFLDDVGGDRPFLVYGHSQGAQNVSRLVREVIEVDDALLDRMVAAFPIGWSLGVDEGERVGGSFEKVPVCSAREEFGCAVGFRSFGGDNELPEEPHLFSEGEEQVCVDPSRDGVLSRTYLSGVGAKLPDVDTEFVLYRDLYTAACEREGKVAGLHVRTVVDDERTAPVDFDQLLLSRDSGTHLLDVQLTLGDLIELAGEKAAAWTDAHP